MSQTPEGTGYTAIAAGTWHSLALKADGSIVSWGSDVEGQVSQAPAGTGYTAVAAGGYHSLALKALVPVPGFSATPVTGFNPLTVTFTDTSTGAPTSWSWDFGDHQTSSTRNASHTYSDPGTYSVSLTVTYPGFENMSVTKTDYITVLPSLVPGFTASPRAGDRPLSVQFTDTTDGGPTAWNWSFGDGQFSTAKNPLHTYTGPGLYTVRLTVTYPGFESTSVTKTNYITVLPSLVPGFTASPRAGDPPLSVQFTDTTAGGPTSWFWSFGDGQLSTAKNPLHTYTAPGLYTVRLTVSRPLQSDRTVMKTDYITVLPPLVPGFTASPQAGNDPLSVQFTDMTEGGPTAWNWSFGDGQFSTAKNPLHTYTSPGLYTVRLTVSSLFQSDRTATMTDYIRVMPLYGGLIRVQAEDYNVGGEGVAYHDTTPGNSGGAYRQDDVDIAAFATRGYFVTSIAEGEWTRYPVWSGAAEDYNYPLSLRLAGWAAGQTVTVTVAGMTGSIDVAVPETGSKDSYAFANATLRLKPGLNMIQFTYHGNAMNFDYFTLDPSGVPSSPTPTPTPTPTLGTVFTIPGAVGLPTCITVAGKYDDVNGNNRKDFADVVLYFNQMTWIAANEPLEAFDYNGNGRIDFADVVWLFNNL